MKSSSIMTVLALGAAVWAVSCQKHQEEEVPAAAGTRTYKCVIASPDTKVAISDQGKTTWEVGDEIVVHGKYGAYAQTVTLTADDLNADHTVATITVNEWNAGEPGYAPDTFYAAYPAKYWAFTASDNCYYYSRFNNTNHPLMAAYQKDDCFVFYNLCGVISFKVDGDFDSYVFSGNNDETVGYTVYQAKVTSAEQNALYGLNEKTVGPLTSITGTVVADGTTVNYIGLPNGTDFTKGFTFKFKKEGVITQVATTSTAVNVARGKLLPLGDITSRLETYVPPVVSDHKSAIPTAGAVDLSASGTANSYIIKAPGIYKLPAVQGNSDTSAGNVFGVELLWETYNNAETVTKNSVIAAVDFEDNWLYIQMPETLKPGNALIAAKDANDVIIWSWHIWIPSTPVTDVTSSAFLASDVQTVAMDRNLGALEAATADAAATVYSYGLLYQWGRKDPFPGAKRVDSSSQAAVAGTVSTVSAELLTAEQAIQQPTVIGYGADLGDWLTPSDKTRWTDAAKTVNDPCPAGYRVPPRNKSWGFMASNLETSEGWSYSAENHYFTVGAPAVVFPLAGFRKYSKTTYALSQSGTGTVLWSAYSSTGGQAYSVQYDSDETREGKIARLVEWKNGTTASVRCVKE